MSIAVIGPNESHRKVVAKALSGAPGRRFREFIDYPSRLSEIPRIVDQGFSVVMIDVDSDESYALKLIEGFAAAGNLMVMAYSQRSDPALRASCVQAGAREFLPLPSGESVASSATVEPEDELAEDDLAEEDFAEDDFEEPEPAPPEGRSEPAQRAIQPPPLVNTRPVVSETPASARPTESETRPEPHSPTSWEEEALAETPAVSEPEEPAKPATAFEEWDTAHLRLTQAGDSKRPEMRSRAASPRELFARSRKQEGAGEAESAAPNRRPETASRPPIPPELLARREQPRAPEPARPVQSEPVRMKEVSDPPPLPPEIFLRDSGTPLPPEVENANLFERSERQVYRPSPQEMMFTSLSTEPDEKKKGGGGMILAVLAAGTGMCVCVACLLFFIRPTATKATVAPTPAAVEAPAEASPQSQPDAFDQEFSTPRPAQKPSAANRAEDTDGSQAGGSQVSSQMMDAQLAAQAKLSGDIKKPQPTEDETQGGFTPATLDNGNGISGAAFSSKASKVVPAGAAISAGVADGLLVRKTAPQYPSIARSAHVEGTVVMGATITKSGAVSNLHVVSGPAMLREAALAAVRTWRYRPYMLNNEPIDADTTISVVFSLGR